MAKELTEGGRSTTLGWGQFRAEVYHSKILQADRVLWGYRDTEGTLYSGVAASEEGARRMAEEQSGELREWADLHSLECYRTYLHQLGEDTSELTPRIAQSSNVF